MSSGTVEWYIGRYGIDFDSSEMASSVGLSRSVLALLWIGLSPLRVWGMGKLFLQSLFKGGATYLRKGVDITSCESSGTAKHKVLVQGPSKPFFLFVCKRPMPNLFFRKSGSKSCSLHRGCQSRPHFSLPI